jgi:thioredoxin 1
MANGIQTVNEQNFDAEVQASELPVLVDFSAVWCGPCKALEPAVKEVAGEYAGQLKVVKVDIDDSPGIATRYQIRGVPTVIVVKGGKEVSRQVGLVPKSKLVALFQSHL